MSPPPRFASSGRTPPPGQAPLRWRSVGLVTLGGTLGTAARQGLGLALPGTGEWPLAVFAVNLTGAFLLGVLLEWLVRTGPDAGPRRDLRLLTGTGFLGGYTTYSTLVVGTVELAAAGHAPVAVAYAVASVLLGLLAAAAGIGLAAGLLRRGP